MNRARRAGQAFRVQLGGRCSNLAASVVHYYRDHRGWHHRASHGSESLAGGPDAPASQRLRLAAGLAVAPATCPAGSGAAGGGRGPGQLEV